MKSDLLIQKYRQHLLLEKGLSPNSISAYMTDLRKLLSYTTEKELTMEEITSEHLEELFAQVYEK